MNPSLLSQVAATAPPRRPRLAIVVGSGGVRSMAALGMAQVLMQHGVRPDLVVGCSTGSIFGALIAAGHSADEAVRIATTLWSADVANQRRWRALPQMVWPRLGRFDADFAMRHDHRVMQRLSQAFGDLHLDELPLPLRVATTNASTGEQVVLHSGSVVQALRASFALPFMFAPAMIDGQRLVDGCLSDPLPVSVAADAHAVLALGFQTPAPHRVNRPSRLLAQVSASMLNNLMQARLAEASASGQRLLRVEPQLQQRVGLFDTAAMPALVDAGRRATEAALPAIMALLQHEPQRGAARRSAVPGP
jgi:NTE family protein